jgi:glycosyltransferase involved in cell wall biosynthesis|tara:strand:- start:38 stop:613 length:576 start_codon:yes stop_codon:yes gene_type:complete
MLPFVSVLCPTHNRHALLPIVIEQYQIQSYPIERRELIILDDSTDRANLHISDKSINYIHHRTRLKIGKKRNMLLRQAKGEIVVWVDDDDLYNKDRILRSVNVLVSRDDVEVIGVKSTVFYDVNSRRFSKVTHTSKNYTCNNIMAHRKSIDCEYADEDAIGEEKVFTSGFQLNAYQFDGLDLCIHMCHSKY